VTFNAGSIEGNVTLDRSPFEREMDAVEERARRFAASSYAARVEVDAGRALAELAAVEARLRALTNGRHDIKIGPGTGPGSLGGTKKQADDAAKSFGIMRVAIEQLGPALVPLAGGAAVGAAALASMGAAGMLAVKGVTADLKAGNATGQAYAGTLRSLQTSYYTLRQTAAVNAFSGFEQSAANLHRLLPFVNAQMASSAHNLGQIAANLTGALAGGLANFGPAIQNAERYLVGLSGTFEKWATGPGGAKFAAALNQDLTLLERTLSVIVPLASHLVAAIAPLGTSSLENIDLFASVLNKIPVPILQAATVAYVAFRTAVAVTQGIRTATVALEGFAAAEAAAAAGAGAAGAGGVVGGLGRVAGGMATVITRAVPFIAAWAGATVAFSAADSALRSWNRSADTTKSFWSNWVGSMKDALTFNFGGIGQHADQYQQSVRDAQQIQQAQQNINETLSARYAMRQGFPDQTAEINAQRSYAGQLGSVTELQDRFRESVAQTTSAQKEWQNAIQRGSGDVGAYYERFNQLREGTNALALSLDHARVKLAQMSNPGAVGASVDANVSRMNRLAAGYASATAQHLSTTSSLAMTTTDRAGIIQGIQILGQYSTSLANAAKSEQGWTKVTDDHTVTIGRDTFELKAWQAAMVQANGDTVRAAAILEGHKRSLALDQAAVAAATTQQQRLTNAVGAAENKYKLTDAQLSTYAASIGISASMLARGDVSQRDFVRAIGDVSKALGNARTNVGDWISAVAQFSQGADTAASRAQLMGAAMLALQGDTLSYANSMVDAATANQQLVTDFDQMKSGVLNLKTGFLDYHNAAAGPVLHDLSQLQQSAMQAATATYQHEARTRGLAQASKDAAAVFKNDTYGALIAEARQLGLTDKQAKTLADRYFHWPKKATTEIKALGTDRVTSILAAILQDLDAFTGQHHGNLYLTGVDTVVAQIQRVGGLIQSLNAEGQVLSVHSRFGGGPNGPGPLSNAQGGLYERHDPQIAKANYRVWGRAGDPGRGLRPAGERPAPAQGQGDHPAGSQQVRRRGVLRVRRLLRGRRRRRLALRRQLLRWRRADRLGAHDLAMGEVLGRHRCRRGRRGRQLHGGVGQQSARLQRPRGRGRLLPGRGRAALGAAGLRQANRRLGVVGHDPARLCAGRAQQPLRRGQAGAAARRLAGGRRRDVGRRLRDQLGVEPGDARELRP
jgi:hypothetical protein